MNEICNWPYDPGSPLRCVLPRHEGNVHVYVSGYASHLLDRHGEEPRE